MTAITYHIVARNKRRFWFWRRLRYSIENDFGLVGECDSLQAALRIIERMRKLEESEIAFALNGTHGRKNSSQ
jgi:hypothetical protein